MKYGFIEEGDKCKECHKGLMEWPETENCSCHIHPPCSACTDTVLTCTECGHEDEPPEYVYVPADPGLSIREYRPRQLDSTKIDYRAMANTASTMIKEGVYPEGTTAAEVAAEVRGTFGGRFAHFGNGKFKYIAYTD